MYCGTVADWFIVSIYFRRAVTFQTRLTLLYFDPSLVSGPSTPLMVRSCRVFTNIFSVVFNSSMKC